MKKDIIIVKPGCATIDYGPLTLKVMAYSKSEPFTEAARQAAEVAVEKFIELANVVHLAKQNIQKFHNIDSSYPVALCNMIKVCFKTGDLNLTPMIAVAGVLADIAAEKALSLGSTKVIVDNGGDCSIRVVGDEIVFVGLRTSLSHRDIYHRLVVDESSGIQGVATSGLGGRSITLGISSATTVAALTGGYADACATLIANVTGQDIVSSNINKVRTELLDPDSDIPGYLAVTEVNNLSNSEIESALFMAERKAVQLGVQGAFIVVGGVQRIVPKSFISRIEVWKGGRWQSI